MVEDVGLVGASEDVDVGLGDTAAGVERDAGVVDPRIEVGTWAAAAAMLSAGDVEVQDVGAELGGHLRTLASVAVLLATHDAAVACRCDRRVHLVDGRLAAPEELA